jgi:hypothetical protein
VGELRRACDTGGQFEMLLYHRPRVLAQMKDEVLAVSVVDNSVGFGKAVSVMGSGYYRRLRTAAQRDKAEIRVVSRRSLSLLLANTKGS